MLIPGIAPVYFLDVFRHFIYADKKIGKWGIHFAALAHIVGWVKRDAGTIYVGFAYLNAPKKFEIATKLANPTRLVADRRLNPTYDLSFRPTKWILPIGK